MAALGYGQPLHWGETGAEDGRQSGREFTGRPMGCLASAPQASQPGDNGIACSLEAIRHHAVSTGSEVLATVREASQPSNVPR